ncbi:YihY/virulence factor BrkB family protein [Bacillus testis]|uniref:YihY/virulence factor BrkB family protein n=1 Tax=Bacillus testis TaxID=1622072 RepID=UPI00067E9B8E|nr:YihY/virulence factor BrkB family protein [Bacillus testis]
MELVNQIIIVIRAMLLRMKDHDVSGMAASLAFFFLLSLFPLLIVVATLLPYLPITESDIISYLSAYIPEDSLKLIEGPITNFMQGSGKLLSLGIVGTLWSSSNAMNGMLKAFNKAYDIHDNRTYIIMRAIALVLTVAMLFVFIVALLLPVFGKQIGLFFFDLLGYDKQFLHMWDAIRWLLSILILFLVFSIVYWVFPVVKMKDREVFWGAIFATVGWSVVSLGFSFYVNNFSHYSTTYGSIGGIIVLMLWFYLLAYIIVLGAELNAMKREC